MVILKQVEGYSKEYYIEECKNDGGVPVVYADIHEAAKAFCEYLRTRDYDEYEASAADAEERILNNSNCDWILMQDGSVLWRRYPKIEEEHSKSGNVKLRNCRKSAGLSQAQLAEKAGISVRVYQNYEQGVRDIEKAQLSVLLRICIALKCNMSDIFTDKEMIVLVKEYHKTK